MHHKFVLIDGPRTALEHAERGVLATGSANWSDAAATRFDEKTLIVRGHSELNLRFQQEFNLLWEYGRLFVSNESIPSVPHIDIAESDIQAADDPEADALFTSANFRAYISSRYGPTFSVDRDANEVADEWVRLIQGAQHSIRIASGHLRSRPIVEALVEAAQARPSLDIRVYLDGQEYLSEASHRYQLEDLDECLDTAAGDAADRRDCLARGFLFSYHVEQAGIPLRFKYYAYRWHYAYADQMHHKYMIIDGDTLVTGSYNLSDNAEHATMENVVVLNGERYRETVREFTANFDAMWVMGTDGDDYTELMDDIVRGHGPIPLTFEPMALTWSQVRALKQAINAACPQVNSVEYRRNAPSYRICTRQ